jgi:hypothetical protein
LNNEIHFALASPLDALKTKVAHIRNTRVLLIIIAKKQYRILSVLRVEDKPYLGGDGHEIMRFEVVISQLYGNQMPPQVTFTLHAGTLRCRIGATRQKEKKRYFDVAGPMWRTEKPTQMCAGSIL